MAKKIEGYIKLQVPAGQANPSPPIGPALGQRGVNIPEFCKQFNAATQKLEAGSPIPTVITVYADRSFTFEMRTPPASYLLKKAAKITKGSTAPGRTGAGSVTPANYPSYMDTNPSLVPPGQKTIRNYVTVTVTYGLAHVASRP